MSQEISEFPEDRSSAAPIAVSNGSSSPFPNLKILYLEDDVRDAELVEQYLIDEFPGSAVTIVTSRFAFVGELQLRTFDIIIADFTLDAFDGVDALRYAQEHRPDVPFVFYSGTIGDDRAVEVIQAGAQDYVPKGKLKRLAVAMRRALTERDVRRKRQEAEDLSRELEGSLNEARVANRKLEEKSGRVQRLENVGLLAAGVAHDLNNMLAPMLMAVPLLRDSISDAEGRKLLDTLEKSAKRGAALVGQILTFAQGGNSEPRIVDPAVLMRDVAMLMTETFPKSLKIEEAISEPLWQVKAIPAQIYQVLLNLCVNARDAMPLGGTITLGAVNIRLDESSVKTIAGSRVGSFVKLSVEDTGKGIPPEVMSNIWDPVMRASPQGKQTNLGLPTVRSIVKRHGGFVQVNTALGVGSSFRVYLPVAIVKSPNAAESSAPSRKDA